jgi:hypothetical protein
MSAGLRLGLRLGLLIIEGDAGFVQAACIHEVQRGVQLKQPRIVSRGSAYDDDGFIDT